MSRMFWRRAGPAPAQSVKPWTYGWAAVPLTRLEPAAGARCLAPRAMLFLQELYEMVLVCPQPVQRSRCPPSAAVRQRAMASKHLLVLPVHPPVTAFHK